MLPAFAPVDWSEIALEAVLSGILDDWAINGTNELDDEDAEDLASLVRLSADIGLEQEEALRTTTFRVMIKGAMHDWVENWNLEE